MNYGKKAILVAGALLCLNFSGYAQSISMKMNGVTVEQAIEELQKKSGYSFVYVGGDLDLDKTVTIDAKQLQEAIEQILKGQGVSYEIQGKNIVIRKGAKKAQKPAKKVTGTVKDETGEAVIGASIRLIGTDKGTITDMDGNFSLDMSEGDEIEVSYIGYTSQTIKYDGQALAIRLKEDTEMLDEVVVVGYGTMKKKDLTGAVSSVKMSDEPIGTVTSVSQVLAGKAAGLQVNTVSAQPGGGTTFRIRGAASSDIAGNNPLIIIDGFPVNDPGTVGGGYYSSGSQDNVLASINPSDIESIEVLKDASSTAIYGSRAGNGVIIITTKRGKSGAAQVHYSGTASLQTMAREYEMLDATSFMKLTNASLREQWMYENNIGIFGGGSEADAASPFVPKYTDAEIANPVRNTDWLGAVLRTGFQTTHNVSINGGTDNTQYMISGNFTMQDGVVKNNGMDRYSLRVNLDQRLSKYVKMGLNLTATRTQYDNVPLGDGDSEYASILVAAARFNPLMPIRDENGDWTMNPEATFLPNPVSLLDVTDKTLKDRLLGTFYVDIEPIKDLHIKGNFGLDRLAQKRSTYLPTTTLYGQKMNGQATIAQGDANDYLMELTATYTKTFGDHSINALLGHSYQSFHREGFNAGNNDFLMDSFLYNNLGAGNADKPSVGSFSNVSKVSSFFARLNYTWKDRYLLTATLRADGASNFAANHRWGYFPSVSVGWRFTEEEFLESLTSVLSNGKLRLSYGQTGNSNIGNRSVSYYSTGYNYTFGTTENVGVYLSQMGNPDLKWETTTEWNLGLDLGFFNNRVNVVAEYFHKVVSDLLSTRSLMSIQEVGSIAANVGKTQSQGFELTINTNNFNTKDFSWSTDFTFSFYRDKWKERSPEWKPSAYSVYDAPLRYAYGYVSDGLIQPGETVDYMPGALPGQVKIKDINGYVYNEDGSVKVDKYGIPLKTGKPDGKLDDADMVIYGSTDPGYLMGFNNTLRWKNFDLNIYFYGQFDMLNTGSYKDLWLTGSNGMTGVVNMYRGYNMPTSVHDVWTSDNQNATRPGFFQDQSTWGIGDYYVDKTWFIRCRNITLGYTIPVKQSRRLVSNVRIYADINNPFVITPYDGLDPETDNSVWAYPNVRSFSLGVDITF